MPVDPGFPGPGYVPPSPNVGSYLGDECPNDHTKSKKPTINDPALLTMNYDVRFQPTLASHPWRAPGSTPGLDPCGLAGGAHTNMSYRVRRPPRPDSEDSRGAREGRKREDARDTRVHALP